uniref:Uncharacterized protein n=1 Tax=Glossina austeni TaxID=7395 RepID=A0A1A9VHN1_GLOAU
MLEEAELMEELEQEWASLEITDMTDQIVNKLISDDMEAPREMKRIFREKQAEKNGKCLTRVENTEKQRIVEKDEIIDIMLATNNNVLLNLELRTGALLADRNSDDDLPEEIEVTTEQTKFLTAFEQSGL